MGSTSTRKVIGIGLVCLMVLFAGCSGSGLLGNDQSDDSDEEEQEETETTQTTETEQPDSSGDSMTPDEEGLSTDGATNTSDYSLAVYEYTEGESYTYNMSFLGSPMTSTWDVVSVDGEMVTVEAVQSTARGSQNTTITANQSSITTAASEDSLTQVFALSRAATVFQSTIASASPGESIQIQRSEMPNSENIEWSEATLDVSGTTTINGVTCTQASLTPEGQNTKNDFCLNSEYPFPITLTSSQSGETVLSMELTDSNRP